MCVCACVSVWYMVFCVYFPSESCVRHSINIARSNLVSAGSCFGKFTKSGTFRLQITALDHVAQYAKVGTQLCAISTGRIVQDCFMAGTIHSMNPISMKIVDSPVHHGMHPQSQSPW